MFEIAKKTFQWGQHSVTLETGEIARQAGGAVMVSMGDTMVLATVVAQKKPKSGQSFFPLTVDYFEKFYAAGRIPGGFFKREGRPTEKETLTARLIDRPIRPLFPEGFMNEVQVVLTVLSSDPEIDSDIPAMIGASAALSLSGVPVLRSDRCGAGGLYRQPVRPQPDGNPAEGVEDGPDCRGHRPGGADGRVRSRPVSEDVMLGAVVFGHEQMQVAINAIEELVEAGGKPEWDWKPAEKNNALIEKITSLADAELQAAYRIRVKQERQQKIKAIEGDVAARLAEQAEAAGQPAPDAGEVGDILFDMQSKIVRSQILAGEPRIDGRDTRTVRPIAIRTGVLPRAHGSALFTRGETQALAVATLGTARDEQIIDAITGEYRERFMMQYNMPPFATGETGRLGTPKRREVGHGRLAKRAIAAMVPPAEEFAYSIRLVSEVLESNGSSSMASVCGGCLALMDAGVPVKGHVAGIAMGLIKDGKKFAVLTDILGDEDHLGDMDFKVAGTESGITALQMDIKIQGITKEIMQVALAQAREARMHILGQMQRAIPTARAELSDFAPRMYQMKINPERIRDVIGKGGATIRAITEETGTTIDIKEDGNITIAAVDAEAARRAQKRISDLTAEVEMGKVYDGTVLKILEFGAIVQVLPGRDGLLHVSQIANERVNRVEDYVKEGQTVRVKVIEADDKGRLRLSMKAAAMEQSAEAPAA